eukprot:Cvel_36540.t1-p1 / transcript=Cvel_36540.t1 / gene=Cvel_36540 / organism=Chromera_velia_CCMP2878 / gene_product=hypothetical protein / transcript_product=hypothetical protein / location=Cvel_scaffold7419:1-1443(-) / protein_length=481 / sequence_SO=supercontig / SO=protein_coding / is_pseudo=false
MEDLESRSGGGSLADVGDLQGEDRRFVPRALLLSDSVCLEDGDTLLKDGEGREATGELEGEMGVHGVRSGGGGILHGHGMPYVKSPTESLRDVPMIKSRGTTPVTPAPPHAVSKGLSQIITPGLQMQQQQRKEEEMIRRKLEQQERERVERNQKGEKKEEETLLPSHQTLGADRDGSPEGTLSQPGEGDSSTDFSASELNDIHFEKQNFADRDPPKRPECVSPLPLPLRVPAAPQGEKGREKERASACVAPLSGSPLEAPRGGALGQTASAVIDKAALSIPLHGAPVILREPSLPPSSPRGRSSDPLHPMNGEAHHINPFSRGGPFTRPPSDFMPPPCREGEPTQQALTPITAGTHALYKSIGVVADNVISSFHASTAVVPHHPRMEGGGDPSDVLFEGPAAQLHEGSRVVHRRVFSQQNGTGGTRTKGRTTADTENTQGGGYQDTPRQGGEEEMKGRREGRRRQNGGGQGKGQQKKGGGG